MINTESAPAKCGMIIKGVGGLYTVLADNGERVLCRARGVFRHDGVTPLVGDRVTLSGEADGGFAIDAIEQRKNILIRPAMANLTHLFVVIPASKPKPDLSTVDKLIAVAEEKNVEPVVVVNKCDADPDEAQRIRTIYTGAGFTCFTLSAVTGEGCSALLDYFTENAKDKVMTSALAGASAAGKSTLMKRLFPDRDFKTGDVSRKTERGRHTTRHVELFEASRIGKCFIADTPGFSLLDFTVFNLCDLSDLPFAFREFADCLGKCRYTKCTHTKEEGCAVLEKQSRGGISKERHDSYVAIYNEIKAIPEWKRKKTTGE